jgi:hypothetical protein
VAIGFALVMKCSWYPPYRLTPLYHVFFFNKEIEADLETPLPELQMRCDKARLRYSPTSDPSVVACSVRFRPKADISVEH